MQEMLVVLRVVEMKESLWIWDIFFWDRATGGSDRFDVREEVCEENGRINGDALVFSLNHLSTIYWAEETGRKRFGGEKPRVLFQVYYFREP